MPLHTRVIWTKSVEAHALLIPSTEYSTLNEVGWLRFETVSSCHAGFDTMQLKNQFN